MTTPLDELVHEHRVHRSLYTEQGFFIDEMTRVFGGTWTYLAHESEIPEPDDFVRKRLGLRPVIVTRDKNGQVNALLNRCTHRGATVCRIDAGNAKKFVCPYHNWTFDNTGALVGVPMRKGYGEEFDQKTLGLGRIRVESYRGLIFGTLNQEMGDLKEHLGPITGPIDDWIDRWPDVRIVARHGSHRLSYRGNWKLTYDNSADGYHPGFSHASLLTMRKDRYGEGVDMQWVLGNADASRQTVHDMGNGHTFLDQRQEIERYWPSAAPMPGQQAYERLIRDRDENADDSLEMAVGSGMNINVFPNLLIIGNQIQVIEPYAVDRTDLVWYATSVEGEGLPDELTPLRMRLQEDFPAFGEPDDLANFEECQAGLGIPEMEWIVTSRHQSTGTEWRDEHGVLSGHVTDELPIRAFWREWKKLMTSGAKLAAT